ncbi:uncharacterized protein PSANT_05716 [Moesziomyces antarcticus]|uniref:Uncharacterized protein n=1 Tax=Pseudozyma antarctica TaxID=84753 RepID=A0A5C3FUC9_PSEA2|nr:uncharacterized protein PSANT_05716 [Moesziomyces antarcticus]
MGSALLKRTALWRTVASNLEIKLRSSIFEGEDASSGDATTRPVRWNTQRKFPERVHCGGEAATAPLRGQCGGGRASLLLGNDYATHCQTSSSAFGMNEAVNYDHMLQRLNFPKTQAASL